MNEHLDFTFELKALDEDGEGTFEGYASVFGETDFVCDIVKKGCFRRTLKEHREKKRMPALLWQHDVREPVGVWREMKEDSHGLFAKGELFVDDIPRARQAHALLKGNGLSGLSIGYRTVKSTIDEKNGTRTLLEVDLYEASLVTFPALDSARVSAVKDFRPEDIRSKADLEKALRDAGFSKADALFITAGWTPPARRDSGGDQEWLKQWRRNRARLLQPSS